VQAGAAGCFRSAAEIVAAGNDTGYEFTGVSQFSGHPELSAIDWNSSC
jgi:hypothetical protein